MQASQTSCAGCWAAPTRESNSANAYGLTLLPLSLFLGSAVLIYVGMYDKQSILLISTAGVFLQISCYCPVLGTQCNHGLPTRSTTVNLNWSSLWKHCLFCANLSCESRLCICSIFAPTSRSLPSTFMAPNVVQSLKPYLAYGTSWWDHPRSFLPSH